MKTIFTKLFIFCGLFFSTAQGIAQNVLTDGNFTSTQFITPFYLNPPPLQTWCSWLNNGTNVNTAVVGEVCKYEIINAGSQSWEVQLVQWGFPLVMGNHYRLTFDVRADAYRTFGVYIGENEGQWTNLNGANYLQEATTDWKTKTIEFDASLIFALHKLSFEMGGNNTSMYFDNIVLENLGIATFPIVEIIGSSIPPFDWSKGMEMQTFDGTVYTLSNYTLPAGEVKFRQNFDWAINWGNTGFPTGYGFQNGPNIPVTPGTYNISFNRISGAYNFACIGCPPGIGIIGSSVPPYNWSADVNMSTKDGIIYTLPDYYLMTGELRFRQDDDWLVNWGGLTFPAGTGNMFAPNIQVVAGTYNITFNRMTGEYYFESYRPSIGILGTSLIGWNDDIDLETPDGLHYQLLDYPLKNGEAKFRQNNDWSVNWGNNTFPTGIGVPGGPNIPIVAGSYKIFFNRHTGEYYFKLVCPSPVMQCNADTIVPATKGSCGAVVWYNPPLITDACGILSLIQTAGLPSGAIFPVGTTTNTFVATNYSDKSATCSFTVTVKDIEAPVITGVSANPAILWPANHTMKNVTIDYKTSDNCGPVTSTLVVSSNEPENATGDGNTSPDWMILDNHQIQLRAERSGTGTGRIYTITIHSTDAAGNTAMETTRVIVPHNMTGANTKGNKVGQNNKEAAYVQANGNQPNQLFDFRVIPNPSSSYFNLQVSSDSKEKMEVNLLDMSGRILARLNTEKNQSTRFGENLRPGMYMIELIQNGQKKITRVVKQ